MLIHLLEQFFEFVGVGAHKARHFGALVQHDKRGHAVHLVLLAQYGAFVFRAVRVNIDSEHAHVGVLRGEFLVRGHDHLARSAPRGTELDDGGDLFRCAGIRGKKTGQVAGDVSDTHDERRM